MLEPRRASTSTECKITLFVTMPDASQPGCHILVFILMSSCRALIPPASGVRWYNSFTARISDSMCSSFQFIAQAHSICARDGKEYCTLVHPCENSNFSGLDTISFEGVWYDLTWTAINTFKYHGGKTLVCNGASTSEEEKGVERNFKVYSIRLI